MDVNDLPLWGSPFADRDYNQPSGSLFSRLFQQDGQQQASAKLARGSSTDTLEEQMTDVQFWRSPWASREMNQPWSSPTQSRELSQPTQPAWLPSEPSQPMDPSAAPVCANCGNVFMPDAIFCRRCGQPRLELEQASGSQSQQQFSGFPSQPTEWNKQPAIGVSPSIGSLPPSPLTSFRQQIPPLDGSSPGPEPLTRYPSREQLFPSDADNGLGGPSVVPHWNGGGQLPQWPVREDLPDVPTAPSDDEDGQPLPPEGEELPSVRDGSGASSVQQFFEAADANHDGVITRKEFEAAVAGGGVVNGQLQLGGNGQLPQGVGDGQLPFNACSGQPFRTVNGQPPFGASGQQLPFGASGQQIPFSAGNGQQLPFGAGTGQQLPFGAGNGQLPQVQLPLGTGSGEVLPGNESGQSPSLVPSEQPPRLGNGEVFSQALEQLAKKFDAAAIEQVVVARVADKDAEVRATALKALGQMAARGDTAAIAAVIPCLQDPDSDVRAAALNTLSQLTGKLETSGQQPPSAATDVAATGNAGDIGQLRQAPASEQMLQIAKQEQKPPSTFFNKQSTAQLPLLPPPGKQEVTGNVQQPVETEALPHREPYLSSNSSPSKLLPAPEPRGEVVKPEVKRLPAPVPVDFMPPTSLASALDSVASPEKRMLATGRTVANVATETDAGTDVATETDAVILAAVGGAAAVTQDAREQKQPALAFFTEVFARGQDDAYLQRGIDAAVAVYSLAAEGNGSEADLPKWQDPWKNSELRGGAHVFVPWKKASGGGLASDCIFFVHGGGFEYGSPREDGYDSLCSRLAEGSGLVVVCPDQPLSGEGRPYKAPEIMDSLVRSLRWLVRHDPVSQQPRLSFSRRKVILAGDSAGATQALSLLLLILNDEELLSVTKGVVLISPWLDLACGSHTYVSNTFSSETLTGDIAFKDPPSDNRAAFRKGGLTYVGSEALLMDCRYSPYGLARAADDSLLQRLVAAKVPIWMCMGGAETLSGEALDFTQRLKDKIPIEMWLHEAMFHDWVMYTSQYPFPSKDKAMSNMLNFIARACRANGQDPPVLSSGIHYYVDEWELS